MSNYIRLTSFYLVLSGTIGFQWTGTPKDGEIFYACVGNDVTFPWSYTLSPGEEITSTEWLFDGSSQEMVAFLSHGAFFPTPAFSGRVHQTANGGIVLSHVTTGDAGNYIIEINIRGGSTMKHTVLLQVATSLSTNDGRVHVHQSPDAVLDSTTQQWSLVLTCGHFNFIGHPAFPVEWLTPSGSVVPSTTYKDGYFQLHLTSPVEDGSYTCRVPQQHVAKACLHGNQDPAGQASVVVDRVDARMTLMEAELRALRYKHQTPQQQATSLVNNLTAQVAILKNTVTLQEAELGALRHGKQQLQQQVTSLENNLTAERQELTGVKNNLTAQVTTLQNTVSIQETEFATLRQDKQQLHQQVIRLENTLTAERQELTDIKNNLTLHEAELGELRLDKQQLQQQVTSLENSLTADRQQLADVKNNLTSTIHQEVNHLSGIITNVDNRMHVQLQQLTSILQSNLTHMEASLTQMIQDVKTPLVGFNAQTPHDQHLSPPSHVKFSTVLYNPGQGFDSSTGDFTAPVSGAYFVIFHTYGYSGYASSYMKANGQEVCRVYVQNNFDHGSCHAVVHLMKGDKVWIEPNNANSASLFYGKLSTSFAGFLFHADP